MGVGARRVRGLFAAAKKAAPCIVFVDELDAIGGSRKAWAEGHTRKTLNQLLVEMDGFEVRAGATDGCVECLAWLRDSVATKCALCRLVAVCSHDALRFKFVLPSGDIERQRRILVWWGWPWSDHPGSSARST